MTSYFSFRKYSIMDKTLQIDKLLLLFILHFLSCAGFPNGAPSSACMTLFPQHDNVQSQRTSVPYTLTLEPKQFQPSDIITVTIADPWGVASLKGLIIAAFKKSNHLESIVGQFVQFPMDKLQPLQCTTGTQQRALTHRNGDNVHNVSLTWRAPDEYIGDVLFRMTLVKDFHTFWHDVHILLVAEDRINDTEPTDQTTEISSMVKRIDFSSCGHSKGCVLYPRYCLGPDCLAAMTYSLSNGSKSFLIELMSAADQNYISLGLSKDTVMGGGDETFTCIYDGFNNSNIQQGYNPGHYNVPALKKHISGQEIRYDNGNLECRFFIPVNTTTEDNEIVYSYISTDKKYVQLAWGSVLPKSFIILKHDNMPAQSDSKVDFRHYALYRGSAFPGLVRVHSVCMIIVWVFICGVTTAISRHFKEFLPHVEIAGTKVWYQLHRGMAIMIIILTTTGLVCVFAHYGPAIRKTAVPHAYVGLTVVTAVYVQILCGLFRPSLEHKKRWIFNWVHRLLGYITHTLAAVTIFLAFRIKYFPENLAKVGEISIVCWIAVQLTWHLILEVYSIRSRKQRHPEAQALADSGRYQSMTKRWNSSILLGLYITCLLCCCLIIVLIFLFY